MLQSGTPLETKTACEYRWPTLVVLLSLAQSHSLKMVSCGTLRTGVYSRTEPQMGILSTMTQNMCTTRLPGVEKGGTLFSLPAPCGVEM